MNIIRDTEFGGERPLFESHDLRLENVVIRAGEEAETHVVESVARRNHQHGRHNALFAQRAHQLVAVHHRHHDVRNNEVDILFRQRIQRFLPV